MNSLINKIENAASLYWLVFVFIAISFLAFQTSMTVIFDLPTFIDEIIQFLMLVSICFVAVKDKSKRFIILSYLVLFTLMFVMSYKAIGHRGLSLVVQQVFVHLKFVIYIGFLFIFVSANVARKFIYIITIFTLVGLTIDLIKPGMLHYFLEQNLQVRGGVIRPIGFQGHTGTLGFFMSLAAAYFVSANRYINTYVKYFVLIVMIVLVVLTTVRTALIVFPLIFLWLLKDSFIKFAPILLFSIAIAFSFGSNKYVEELVSITEQNIEMSIESPMKSAYIRGMMLYFSFELATDRFPLGTGAATFGTVKSDDSNIYAELGVQNSRFFIEKDGIYDSNFASVLGEFGYFGTIFYYASFIWFCLRLIKMKNQKANKEYVFVLLSLMLVYSITNPIFMNTYQIFMFGLFFLAGQQQVENSSVDVADALKDECFE